ncbi:flagellar hook-associated protein FlgK, partial [Citrobacter freundii]|nr:flagellar hook-associated protein FlgK [Citrobacter freundii]
EKPIPDEYNTQHKEGFDANCYPNKNFFDISGPAVLRNTTNKGNGALDVKITDSTSVQGTDYKITFDCTDCLVTPLAD